MFRISQESSAPDGIELQGAAPPARHTRVGIWGGIECTINRVGDRYLSQGKRVNLRSLALLEKCVGLGISALRYPILWEDVAPDNSREPRWVEVDRAMEFLRTSGVEPIVGLVHHGSGPPCTSLLDPDLPRKLSRYAGAVAARYPWVKYWTPINEPLTTARFSCLYGHWFPHMRGARPFADALLNQLRAIVYAMSAIREFIPEAKLVQTEDLGETSSTRKLAAQAAFENERRWLTYDLLTGHFDRDGIVGRHFRSVGIPDEVLRWFETNRCAPDIVGVNHYVTSNRYLDDDLGSYPRELHGGNGRQQYVDAEAVRACPHGGAPITSLLLQTWKRYSLPIAVTEAHLGCTREEQLRWFREILHSARQLRSDGVAVEAVTAWSIFGAFDWDSLLTRDEGHYEPGLFDLRSSPPRPTALARFVAGAARDDKYDEELASLPGWWRRSIRIPREFGGSDPFEAVRGTHNAGARLLHSRARPCAPVLITGATGTLGQAFARICYLRGIPYRLVARGDMDIADEASVAAMLEAERPWAVINTAGFVRVDEAEVNPAVCSRENFGGVRSLARGCARAGVRLVTFSSDLVFDGGKGAPYQEDDPTNPLNEYGRSKARAELAALEHCSDALVIRTSAFFGPWDQYNFARLTLNALVNRQETRWADDLWVSPTYVPDLVNTTLDLLVDHETGIWNVANRGGATWYELACAVADAAGHSTSAIVPCSHRELGWTAPRPRNVMLTSQRGIHLPSWETALESFIRSHHDDPLAGISAKSREACPA